MWRRNENEERGGRGSLTTKHGEHCFSTRFCAPAPVKRRARQLVSRTKASSRQSIATTNCKTPLRKSSYGPSWRRRIVSRALLLLILLWLCGFSNVACPRSGVANASTFTSMDTFTSPLNSARLESLISLPLSDSVDLLNKLPQSQREAIARQLAAMAGLKIKPELRRMPLVPTPRQADFLALTCREALYGGAAGGGKSEALLMWLAEGIDIPHYSGIIFRRIEDDLTNSNDSLVAKAMRLYGPLGGVVTDSGKCWRFPSGAMIQLAGLNQEQSVMKHQGPSYHRIAFDELTHFTLSQYEFLVLSRIRSEPNFPIYKGARGASNPGGPGHSWVLNRFITQEAIESLRLLSSDEPCPPGLQFLSPRGHGFVPARLADNPYIDQADYRAQMSGFSDPVMRERMLNGDWSVMPNTKISAEWLRYFDMQGQIIRLYDATGKPLCDCDERDCRRFATIDTAGTSEDVAKDRRGKPPSWSVVATWDKLPSKFGNKIVLRNVWRKRVGLTDLLAGINGVYADWKPKRLRIEDKHFGPGVADMLRKKMPITTIAAGREDKLERATDFLNMLERGEIFLPKYDNDWRPALEAEWLAWQGHPDETADQIDVASYAAWESKEHGSSWGGPVMMSSSGNRIGAF